ncbi:MAG: hypothetical protein WC725_05040 [Patescibacteria group bacterium]
MKSTLTKITILLSIITLGIIYVNHILPIPSVPFSNSLNTISTDVKNYKQEWLMPVTEIKQNIYTQGTAQYSETLFVNVGNNDGITIMEIPISTLKIIKDTKDVNTSYIRKMTKDSDVLYELHIPINY